MARRSALAVLYFTALQCSQAADLPMDASRCAALPQLMAQHWPDHSTRLNLAQWVVAGSVSLPSMLGGAPNVFDAPEHCEIVGAIQERIGEGGQHYAIKFHLRLPARWNGRLYFQGGGGSNGIIGDAWGMHFSAGMTSALAQGFAVVSQDSGHDNAVNNDPARGGVLVFGFDEQARANYGHASLPVVADAAKAAVKAFYGKQPNFSYFVGCSKGGEEGMVLAQRYASQFDGIAAGSPGMSLPRAALAEAWDTQALSAAAQPSDKPPNLGALPAAFTDKDLILVRDAVLAACDASDGLVDGIVGDFRQCTSVKVRPQLGQRQCTGDKTDGCLSARQIDALVKVMQGAHDSHGNALYTDWPWDSGIATPGWRIWKLGNQGGMPPSLNVVLGGASLASNFTTPPTAIIADPNALFDFLLSFDFDKDAPKIYAKNSEFPHSAWEDISARSNDLSAFKQRHGKLLITHGVSDAVFSIHDTIKWWHEVDERNGGKAGDFARLFPVPGMNHCGGGDATDQFDVLAPLMDWVEQGHAPDRILAAANPRTPWPKRTRPLCVYPSIARYKGSGDTEKAESFACVN